MGYVVYATGDNGNGYVQQIGSYTDLSEIIIHIGMFSQDVVLSIEVEEVTETVPPISGTTSPASTPIALPNLKLK